MNPKVITKITRIRDNKSKLTEVISKYQLSQKMTGKKRRRKSIAGGSRCRHRKILDSHSLMDTRNLQLQMEKFCEKDLKTS